MTQPRPKSRRDPAEATDDERLDALFGALADERRRLVVAAVASSETPVSVETLARDVAATEADVPVAAVETDDVKRRHLTLHHADIPKLADAGLLAHDPDADTVAPVDGVTERAAALTGE